MPRKLKGFDQEVDRVKKHIGEVSKAVSDAYVGIGRAVYEPYAESISSDEAVRASKKAKDFPMVPSHKRTKK